MFPTKPGVEDPMAIPAGMYPTMVGSNGWKAGPSGDNPTKERQDQSDRDVDKQW